MAIRTHLLRGETFLIVFSSRMNVWMTTKEGKKRGNFNVRFGEGLWQDWLCLSRLCYARKGFGAFWRKLIYGCLSSAHLSVNINGSPKGSFQLRRDLDSETLSPIPFYLGSELPKPKIIANAESKSMFKGFQVGLEKVNVSHYNLRITRWF